MWSIAVLTRAARSPLRLAPYHAIVRRAFSGFDF
jgi:hypothetical protein